MDTEQNTLDLSEYPATWDEFVGQDAAKRVLKVAAKSAQRRGVPMGHTLISSPIPGVGKTSLALLACQEMGAKMKVHVGPVDMPQLPYLFMGMKPGDFLFLDEAHRLVEKGKGKAEWLLNALQDGEYPTLLGMEKMPPITIIAATTDAGRLPQPILDRFEITPTVEPYGDDDGAQIAVAMAHKVLVTGGLMPPTLDVAARIARAANNSPRHMRRILCALRDLVWTEEVAENDGAYDLTEALNFAGVTEDGLTAQAQKYLRLLMRDFRGNPAGAKMMGDRLGEVGSGLVEIERTLLNKGLIAFTRGGRTLTPNGRNRAQSLQLALEGAR